MMMAPQDEDDLQRICGGNIPKEVSEAYSEVIRLKHKCEAGPLGMHACVLLAYSCGVRAGETTHTAKSIPWREVIRGTPVDVRRDDKWSEGAEFTFDSQCGQGTIAVKMGPDTITEFNAVDVRLSVSEIPDGLDEETFERTENHEDKQEPAKPKRGKRAPAKAS